MSGLYAVLIAGSTVSILAGSAIDVQALEVDRVQLAVVDNGGGNCPRNATVTAWAHTNGPGTVKFVIRNDGGGKTGTLSATAVKGAAGTYLATYKQTFKITTNVDVKYMAEAIGHGKISNWVPFKATCGPQVRKGKAPAKKSGGGPPAKKTSDVSKAPKPSSSDGKPASNGKPAGTGKSASGSGKPAAGSGKPVKQCGDVISVTRLAALTRIGGRATAEAGWATEVKKHYPSNWGNWNNARNRSSSCKFAGTWNCTASARPCPP